MDPNDSEERKMLVFQLIEPELHIYASVNKVIISSDNDLSPVWRQAIIWTNDGLLLIGSLRTSFSEIWTKIQ